MYLYFNEKGILKEIVNDEAIRLGNNDLNHIYIYWENAPEVDSMWVKFKLPSGETTNELSYSHIKVKKVIPYDKQRDLKYFKDYVSYDFFDISIPDGLNENGEVVGLNVLTEDGLVSASVRFVLTLGQAISTLGLITFNVEKSVIQADLGINQSQFDYLLKHMLLNTTDTIIYKVDDITSVDASKIPNNAILMTTTTTDLTAPNPLWVEFYINNDGSLENIGLTEHYDIIAPIRGWKSGKIYYGYISANYTNSLNLSGFYIGYNLGSNYYILNKGKWYETSYTLGHGQVIVTQSTSNGLTQLTNLLVDEILQVREQIYKGMGTITENNEVLNRGEIKEEFVEQVKTGTTPRVYGVDSNDEQVMYEVRNLTVPNSIVQRNANGQAYIVTPTQPAHIANKGYVDGEITTLRDESMNYTDDEVTGAIAGLKDESGKIRSDLLPSYVDDVVEHPSKGAFPATGEKGKIYVDTSTNESYRWSGTQYIELMSGDYYLRANGEKLELDLEKLEKVTPTDIVADGNTIKLYHDSTEITGQENPITFKTVNGVSVIGVGDIETDNIQVLDTNFDLQTLVPLFTDLSDLNNNITDYATLQDRMGFVKILGADSVKMQFFVGLKDSEDETAGTITYKLYQASCVINGNIVENWTIDYENKSNSVYVDLTNNVLYRAMEFVEVPYYTYEKNIDTLMVLLAKEINEELLRKLMESKADTDGYYPQMRVGLSDNLYSPDGVVDETPYTFRETAGTLNVETGNAEIQSVKGNTIGWNQYVKDFTTNWEAINGTISVTDNILTYTITTTKKNNANRIYKFLSDNLISTHKYLYMITAKTSSQNGKLQISFSSSKVSKQPYAFNFEFNASNQWQTFTTITELGGDTFNNYDFRIALYNTTDNDQVGDTYDVKDIQIFDLTLMFGAGNEPETVEEFRAMFPNSYYEYNPGELKSVNVTGIKTVGFNAFDGELTIKYEWTNDGELVLNNNIHRVSCSNLIKVLSNQEYEINASGFIYDAVYVFEYDVNKKTIQVNGDNYTYLWNSGTNANTITLSNQTAFIGVFFENSATEGIVLNEPKICVHLTHTGYKNGTHEPYWTETRYIDNALELRSAGSVYDELTKDKKITRIGSVDLGTLEPDYSNTYSCWRIKVLPSDRKEHTINMISNKYAVAEYSANVLDKTIWIRPADDYIYFKDSSLTSDMTPAQVKQALSGVILYYELADYVEEPLPLQNLTYKVDDFGTEEWLQTSDIPVPVAHSTLYMRNLRDDVRTLSETYTTKSEFNKVKKDVDKLIRVVNPIEITIPEDYYNDPVKLVIHKLISENLEGTFKWKDYTIESQNIYSDVYQIQVYDYRYNQKIVAQYGITTNPLPEYAGDIETTITEIVSPPSWKRYNASITINFNDIIVGMINGIDIFSKEEVTRDNLTLLLSENKLKLSFKEGYSVLSGQQSITFITIGWSNTGTSFSLGYINSNGEFTNIVANITGIADLHEIDV